MKADAGKLEQADFEGGTFSVSSVGNLGGTYMSPTILRPQTAIMAIGKARRVPRFNENDEVVARYILSSNISADHRVLDGATVARFSEKMKEYLENPNLMLLSMS